MFFCFLTVKLCAHARERKEKELGTCWAPSVKLWAQWPVRALREFRQSLAVARAPVKLWPSESSPSDLTGRPGPY